MVRGKFRLEESTQFHWCKEARKLTFAAVCNDDTDENVKFHEATPNGRMEMIVNNPQALAEFEVGQCYYLDFTLANTKG